MIIEFRNLARTAKQFVRHSPQYPENLSKSVNIILLFLLRETLGEFNIDVLTSSETVSVPKGKISVVSSTVARLFFVVLIRPFQLSSDYDEDMSKGSVCYLQFHHKNNRGFVPSCV